MPEELESFEQCWLTGTAAEVTPVGSIGDYNFEVGAIAVFAQLPLAVDDQDARHHDQRNAAQHDQRRHLGEDEVANGQRQQDRGILERGNDRRIGVAVTRRQEDLANAAAQTCANQRRGLGGRGPDPAKGQCQQGQRRGRHREPKHDGGGRL